jgi:hypothetical protein
MFLNLKNIRKSKENKSKVPIKDDNVFNIVLRNKYSSFLSSKYFYLLRTKTKHMTLLTHEA